MTNLVEVNAQNLAVEVSGPSVVNIVKSQKRQATIDISPSKRNKSTTEITPIESSLMENKQLTRLYTDFLQLMICANPEPTPLIQETEVIVEERIIVTRRRFIHIKREARRRYLVQNFNFQESGQPFYG